MNDWIDGLLEKLVDKADEAIVRLENRCTCGRPYITGIRDPLSFRAMLRAKLKPLLEAGEVSEELLESSVAHVSHGGPTRAQAEAAIQMYRAAKAAALKEQP